MKEKISVLVVDDSKVAQLMFAHILESDPRIQIAGVVSNGEEALKFVKAHQPDIVLMDILMPRMDGYEATRLIMESNPLPIVICSVAADPKEVATMFRVMEAGALTCVEKPAGRGHPDFDRTAANLVQTLKLMSEVKVVRRRPRSQPIPIQPEALSPDWRPNTSEIEFVGIGASTGGPPVLQTILAGLPKNFVVPILIVQHISHGFLPGLADWLNQTTGLQVHVGAHGVRPLPGHVYLAPDDFHMGLNANRSLLLTREEPENGLRPAVSFLFRSLAGVCGARALGILLTGMGKDGVDGLKLMKECGAITIAQDRDSSVIHGMPGQAIAIGAARYVLPADKIADALVSFVQRGNAAAEIRP